MKKTLWRISLLLALSVLLAAPVSAQKDPKVLKFPAVEFKPLKPHHVQIQKGIQLYYVEDHETPFIYANVIFQNGSLNDPQGKEGLVSFAFRLLKGGGTASRKADLLEEQLDFLGSSIGSSAGGEFSTVSMSTLSKNFTKTWEILCDVLNNPAYAPERVDLEKKRELEVIRRRWDQPMSVGFTLFRDLIYGRGFPDARRTSKKSIESITPEELRLYYQKQIKGSEIIIAASGDFSPRTLIGQIKKSFTKWPGTAREKPVLPKATLAAKPGIYLIDKPDMTQAVVCLGHLGINRLDPDNVEVEILNFIYGSGGFNSRIMREVRSNRGLAYAAMGYVGSGRDLGLFFNFCQTKSQSVAEAIGVVRDIARDITQTPVNPDELETAKKYTQNSFVHLFESPMSVLNQTLFLKLQGFPDDYYDTYVARTQKVDAAKVLAMAKRMINPEQLVIMVVGKKAEIIEQLKKLGEVTELALPED